MVSFLLALLLLAVTALPALAWFDEGIEGKPTRLCRVISDNEGPPLILCRQIGQAGSTWASPEQPLLHPAIARAELMFEGKGAELPTQVLAEH
jgi:hypothetical protein